MVGLSRDVFIPSIKIFYFFLVTLLLLRDDVLLGLMWVCSIAFAGLLCYGRYIIGLCCMYVLLGFY